MTHLYSPGAPWSRPGSASRRVEKTNSTSDPLPDVDSRSVLDNPRMRSTSASRAVLPAWIRSRYERPLLASGGKRVFILGGGAALGAHHVGALRYLEEQGITPD